ncbi:restriction endonuclease [Clostridium chromiireducens]|uniref:restriction endonuclease n=1 Tax=Clostridium chromiireducens TaxID=225345 RepID=UPI003AF49A21
MENMNLLLKDITSILITVVFIKNFFKNYIKMRKKYRRLWKIDYFYIILNSIFATIKEIAKAILELSKEMYSNFIFKDVEYNYDEIIDKINKMSPRYFELFCAALFDENKNYINAKATEASCDGGKDVIAMDCNFNKIYIECKHYIKGNHVGRPEVQKLIGACVADNVKKAIFITTSSYSPEALECAGKVNWIQLWTMEEILKAISKLNKDKIHYILNDL